MSELSSSAQATVRQFALQMELEPYQANDGSYSFQFENSGRLSILAGEDNRIIVSLTSKILADDIRGYAVLMPAAGYSAESDTLFHVGANRAGQPVLAEKMLPETFNLPNLEQSFSRLVERLARLSR